jgi:hypothetical protein
MCLLYAYICLLYYRPCDSQAFKYRSVTDIVRPICKIVRLVEGKPPDILSDLSETEVYCLSDPSVLVSDLTVTLSDVNQNVV